MRTLTLIFFAAALTACGPSNNPCGPEDGQIDVRNLVVCNGSVLDAAGTLQKHGSFFDRMHAAPKRLEPGDTYAVSSTPVPTVTFGGETYYRIDLEWSDALQPVGLHTRGWQSDRYEFFRQAEVQGEFIQVELDRVLGKDCEGQWALGSRPHDTEVGWKRFACGEAQRSPADACTGLDSVAAAFIVRGRTKWSDKASASNRLTRFVKPFLTEAKQAELDAAMDPYAAMFAAIGLVFGEPYGIVLCRKD